VTCANPKRQFPNPKKIPNNLGGKDSAKIEGFDFQIFFGVWDLRISMRSIAVSRPMSTLQLTVAVN
jgi:hypothetical protein